ncbi:hypothetical protein KQI63_05100 [bacterium]|nr:hypothetical protein [bacterium]
MIEGPRILVGTEPPGGAVTLFPVVDVLRSRGADVRLLGAGYASVVFRRRGMRFQDIAAQFGRYMDDGAVLNEINRYKPDVILTGVVGDRETGLDYRLLRGAAAFNIPRVGILDSWMHLSGRFEAEDGSNPLHYLPDMLGVPDHATVDELVALGIKRDHLEVVGHPYHAEIKWLAGQMDSIRKRVRSELGIREREMLLAFISEPLSWLRERDGSDIGYDEFDAFSLLHAGADKSGLSMTVVVKDHPRRPTLAAEVGTRFHSMKKVRLLPLTDPAFDALDLVLASDIVAGMSSTLLVHGALLGKRTLCLQPGLKEGMDLNVLTRRKLLPNLGTVDDVASSIWDGVVSRGGTEGIRALFGWESAPDKRAADMVLGTVDSSTNRKGRQ